MCKFKKQGYTDKQKREAGVNDTSVKEKAGFFSSSGGRSVNRLLHRWPSHTHTGRPTDLTGGHINTSKESSIQKHIPRLVWTTAVFLYHTFVLFFVSARSVNVQQSLWAKTLIARTETPPTCCSNLQIRINKLKGTIVLKTEELKQLQAEGELRGPGQDIILDYFNLRIMANYSSTVQKKVKYVGEAGKTDHL